MKDSTGTKEQIIAATISLIEESNGEPDTITFRMIAQKADVGLGLINYHFGSKEKLIGLCVHQIMSRMIVQIPTFSEIKDWKERLCAWLNSVYEFLFRHPALSKISILSDYHDYSDVSNSVLIRSQFLKTFPELVHHPDSAQRVFTIMSALETSFLASEACGFDLNTSPERKQYINTLVSLIFPE